MSKVVLVTGGAGYIGSHTAVELITDGFEVIIADDLSNSEASVIDNIEKITGIRPQFVQIDLANAEDTHRLFAENSIDAVIHFAARKYVNESVRMPLLYYRNNLYSLLNVLQEMKNHDVRYCVFSSSCTVYGEADRLPVTEQSPVKPALSPYGNTKQIAEEILRDIAQTDNMCAVALRYFNPIGAHDSGLIGELPLGVPQNLLPYITQTAAGIRPCLQVFGDDYQTPDGTCLRDYLHIEDLAQSHVCALRYLFERQNRHPFEVFNIGTGEPYSVLDIIRVFEKVSLRKLNYKIVGRREGDVEKIWADASLAKEILGWKARKRLEQMVESAWRWQQNLETFYQQK
jgi:UDP-glucose 4-epimerase